jgi:hypothetical protein
MKSIDTLVKLSQNPHYHLSEEEQKAVDGVQQPEPVTSSVTVDEKKKESQVVRGNAAVKETGKLDKHPSDPIRG